MIPGQIVGKCWITSLSNGTRCYLAGNDTTTNKDRSIVRRANYFQLILGLFERRGTSNL